MITNALPPFLCTVYIPIINDAGASTATALLTTVLPNGLLHKYTIRTGKAVTDTNIHKNH